MNDLPHLSACLRRAAAALLLASACTGALAQKTMPIGSSSMAPTFAKTDAISINLLAYLLSSPARWDVVVYQSVDEKTFLTHRVVGIPGDTVMYDAKKRLHLNGVPVVLSPFEGGKQGENPGETIFMESLGRGRHFVQLRAASPAVMERAVDRFAGREQCTYAQGGFSCTVPADHYFVMGDNRDGSHDSRYVGFVHAGRIGGRVENAPTLTGKR